MLSFSAWLHALLGITTRTPLLDWRLRLAGRKPPPDGWRQPSIRVSKRRARTQLGAPKHLKMDALPSALSKPGAGSPLLTGGLSARCSDGRPGPVLDATLPSSPVFSPQWLVNVRAAALRGRAGHAAEPWPAPVDLAFTLARQLVSRAPAGTSPCSTYLHNAISSLRARATTPTLRARLPC